jgi:glycogen synthase
LRILLASYAFAPSVGGLEEVNDLLAHAFVERGHAVKVVTMTPETISNEYTFEILRGPAGRALIRAVGWCDVFLQANVSFRLGWPNLLFRRPCVTALHGNLDSETSLDGMFNWKGRLKQLNLRLCDRVVACSHAVARRTFPSATVIPNPYRDSLFRRLPRDERDFDLVFLGRLVSDKGVNLLISALAQLRERNISPSLLIIGGGPEEAVLRAQVQALRLDQQITFQGFARGEKLVELLNRCRIMVIPSIWEEPFGIVALEGIACGCAVVAADAGGLPEAVGPCGMTFRKGDPQALAAVLNSMLADEKQLETFRGAAATHLAPHRPRAVAESYLNVLSSAAGS